MIRRCNEESGRSDGSVQLKPGRRILGCLIFLSVVHANAQTNKDMADKAAMRPVDEFIQSEMATGKIPALAVSVYRNGRIIYEAGYGVADRENHVAATPNTPFYLASVTKALTGTALVLLEAQHKIAMNRPVNEYLKGAKLHSPVWDTSGATVLKVASHTSGLTTYNRKCAVKDRACKVSTDTAISRYGVLFWPAGDHFDYSNIGYGVLGKLIGDVSGIPFDQFLEREIFHPLGMANCYLPLTGELRSASAVNYDQTTGQLSNIEVSDTPGASSARCSSHDLAKLGAFALKQPLLDQRDILSPTQLDELLYSDSASAGEHYSFGWDRNQIDGYSGLFAQGGTSDSFALLQLVPSEHIAVAIVANTGTTLPFEIANRIVARLLPVLPSKKIDSSAPATPVASALEGQWTGQIKPWSQNIPVSITISSSHEALAKMGADSATNASCEKVELSASRFYCVAHGSLGTPDGPKSPYPIEVELYLRQGRLMGAATTGGGVQLPSWIELSREAPKTTVSAQ